MKKHNADRRGNSKMDLFSFKNQTSARLSPTTLFAAFFEKLIKVKKSTRKTTVALMNSLQLLPAATRQTLQSKYRYAFFTNSHTHWLCSSVIH